MMPATIAVLPAVRSDLPFDVERSLSPVSLLATGPGILAVHPSVPVRNAKELIALARAKPGVLNYGSSGVGASTHLKAELFKSMAKLNIVMVPYKGTSELAVATASGEVDMSFPSLTSALPLMAARKVKALGVTSATRTPLAPELPTVSETGLPGYEHMGWYGMFAPAGVSGEVIARLNGAIAAAVNAPGMKEVLAKDGFEPKTSTPEQFAAFMRREIAQNLKLIKASGVKPAAGPGG
jgi:tripartite-type tricarboxylate transporter receptor subunit TctC